MDDPRQYIERLEFACREQIDKINELRTEVQRLLDWIMGDADAHTVLQSVYLDPSATQTNKIKAAAASLPFEKPKLMTVPPPLELRAETLPLKDLLEIRRARQEGLGSTEPPIEVLSIADGRRLNGNGDDGNGGNGNDS